MFIITIEERRCNEQSTAAHTVTALMVTMTAPAARVVTMNAAQWLRVQCGPAEARTWTDIEDVAVVVAVALAVARYRRDDEVGWAQYAVTTADAHVARMVGGRWERG